MRGIVMKGLAALLMVGGAFLGGVCSERLGNTEEKYYQTRRVQQYGVVAGAGAACFGASLYVLSLAREEDGERRDGV